MIEYMYEVICEDNEFLDKKFEDYESALEYARSNLSSKPIINEVEVSRNDFGECDSADNPETVWTYESEAIDEQVDDADIDYESDTESEDEYFARLADEYRDNADLGTANNTTDGDIPDVTDIDSNLDNASFDDEFLESYNNAESAYFCNGCKKYLKKSSAITDKWSEDRTPYGGAGEPGFTEHGTDIICPYCGSDDLDSTAFDENMTMADFVQEYFEDNDNVTEADRNTVKKAVFKRLTDIAGDFALELDDDIFNKNFDDNLDTAPGVSESYTVDRQQEEEIDYDKLREELEEKEDEVECQECGDLYSKCDCTFNEAKHGYVCKNCSDENKEPMMFVEAKDEDDTIDVKDLAWIYADKEYGYYKLLADASLDDWHRLIRISKEEYRDLKERGAKLWTKADDESITKSKLKEHFIHDQKALLSDLCKKAGLNTLADLKKFMDDKGIDETKLVTAVEERIKELEK